MLYHTSERKENEMLRVTGGIGNDDINGKEKSGLKSSIYGHGWGSTTGYPGWLGSGKPIGP